MGSLRQWSEVPASAGPAWQRAFEEVSSGHALTGACPICGVRSLHRYYSVGPPLRLAQRGFVSRGGLWEWCSSCGSYEHASVLVPDWWENDLVVDETILTTEPDELQRSIERMG